MEQSFDSTQRFIPHGQLVCLYDFNVDWNCVLLVHWALGTKYTKIPIKSFFSALIRLMTLKLFVFSEDVFCNINDFNEELFSDN